MAYYNNDDAYAEWLQEVANALHAYGIDPEMAHDDELKEMFEGRYDSQEAALTIFDRIFVDMEYV